MQRLSDSGLTAICNNGDKFISGVIQLKAKNLHQGWPIALSWPLIEGQVKLEELQSGSGVGKGSIVRTVSGFPRVGRVKGLKAPPLFPMKFKITESESVQRPKTLLSGEMSGKGCVLHKGSVRGKHCIICKVFFGGECSDLKQNYLNKLMFMAKKHTDLRFPQKKD